MKLFLILVPVAVLGAVIFLAFMPSEVEILPSQSQESGAKSQEPVGDGQEAVALLSLQKPEEQAQPSTSSVSSSGASQGRIADIEKQAQLQNPPEVIKGIYVTAWVAGSYSRMTRIIDFIKRTELNAVIVDIKDFSGYVSYRTGIDEVAASGAEGELRILQPNALIKRLHDEGIYVIARQTVFQDPILAKARPEWALKNASSGAVWKDNKGLSWMDPSAKPVWDYNIAIAKDAFARGFDEVNFDYIRFASDGDLSKISYPVWDQKTSRAAVIRSFFKYLRENLQDQKISADLFGLATIDTWDDLGIGQVIEDAYEYFDYICPMVYPSHYAKGFNGFQNPAEYPYEVVKYSMDKALERLKSFAKSKEQMANSSSTATTPEQFAISPLPSASAKLRPWLQDFDLGAVYDAAKVRAQIQATYDALLATPAHYNGWMLWNPANNYTEGALEKE